MQLTHPHPPVRSSIANAETITTPQLSSQIGVPTATPVLDMPPGMTVAPSTPAAPLQSVERDPHKADPDPAEVVALNRGDRSTGSRDVLSGWGWSTGTVEAVDDEDFHDTARASRRRLMIAIGGALGVVMIIVIVAFAFSGSPPASEQDKRAMPTPAPASAAAAAPAPAQPPEPTPAPAAPTDPTAAQPPANPNAGPPASEPVAQPPSPEPASAAPAKPEPTRPDPGSAAPAAVVPPERTAPPAPPPEPPKAAAIAPPTPEPARPAAIAPPAPEPPKAAAIKAPEPRKVEPPKAAPARAEPARKLEAKKPPEPKPPERAPKRPPPPDKLAQAKPPARAQPLDPYAATDKPAVDPAAAYKAGLQQYARGDTSGALATFRGSLSQNPGFAPTWRGIGLVYEKLGNKGQARAAFKHYLQLAPDAIDADPIRDRMERLGP